MNDVVLEKIRLAMKEGRDRILAAAMQITLDKLTGKTNPLMLAYLYPTTSDAIRVNYYGKFTSSCETIFGGVIENIAISLCEAKAKSGATGIDLDILRNNIRLILSVKSGSNWGNSSSSAKQGADFDKYKDTIRANERGEILSVMGITYGNSRTSTKLDYADLKIVGQNFWTVLTGDPNSYLEIAEVLQEGNVEFWGKLVSVMDSSIEKLTREFNQKYPDANHWKSLVKETCENYSPDDELTNRYVQQNV